MSRQQMIESLDSKMRSDREYFDRKGKLPSARNPLKSYLVEANVEGAQEGAKVLTDFFASDGIATKVLYQETEDSTVHTISVGKKATEFWLDTLDDRYWILHTSGTAGDADSAIRNLVNNSRYLDSIWMPTRFFESTISSLGLARNLTAKFSIRTGLYQESLPEDDFLDGSLLFRIGAAENALARWLEYRSIPELSQSLALWSAKIVRREDSEEDVFAGMAIDDVTASGKVTARGNSFYTHQELLQVLKNQYAALIDSWESKYRLTWSDTSGRLKPSGTVAVISFPNGLTPDQLEGLVGQLFDSGEPYRLYARPQLQGESRVVAHAIDLHTGDKINFEITQEFMHIYLFPTTCGNVLARLITNLQHFYDARIELSVMGHE